MKINTRELEKSLYEVFNENRLSADVYSWGENRIDVEISWGDWKHEHLRCKFLVEEFLKKTGVELISVNTNVTEEDGSDCYSAIHSFYIC